MDRICWRLANVLSEALAPTERDAVRGDLMESHESGSEALRDVLGLVIRRYAALLSDWRTWVALLGLIIPVSMLLSIASQNLAGIGSVYSWLYFNNWDWGLLRSRGFWYVLSESARELAGRYLTLACWSWSAGFLLGRTSAPRRAPLNSVLFFLTLLFVVLVGAPRYLTFFSQEVHRALALPRISNSNDPVSALMFYRVIFPLLVQAFLVAVPAVWGIYEGVRVEKFRPALRKVVWAVSISSLIALLIQQPGLVFLLLWESGMPPQMWHGWPPALHPVVQLLHWIVYWPLAYWVTRALGHRRTRAETVLA
ncbi:MAG TPA: hypothetical protein VJX16_15215 [Terriglobales bacterium]|nr:hypothetical protein [Terriglobales bacterium]